jgi:hypothetical protein
MMLRLISIATACSLSAVTLTACATSKKESNMASLDGKVAIVTGAA